MAIGLYLETSLKLVVDARRGEQRHRSPSTFQVIVIMCSCAIVSPGLTVRYLRSITNGLGQELIKSLSYGDLQLTYGIADGIVKRGFV